jgi:GWxTD domain-containing protein
VKSRFFHSFSQGVKMFRPRALKASIPVILLLILAVPLRARKTVEMPDNFGRDDWAVSHWEEAVGYLKYVGDKEDRQKMLSVPENLRLEAWEEFWKKFDPVSTTPANEFRDEYFARIRQANDNFASILRPGWLTDRGEVYIRMGAPRNVEKFNTRAGGRDIEVWEYWISYDVTLVFMDTRGGGDMDLLNPSVMVEWVFEKGAR